MRPRLAAGLPWSLWLLSALLGSLGVLFTVLSLSVPEARENLVFAVGVLLLAVVYPGVGALIASRQPHNAVGWILIAIGFCQAVSGSSQYGAWGFLVAATPPPLAAEALWLGNWIWVPSLGLLATFLPLLFPSGRLPSRRWRPVAWIAVAGVTLAAGTLAVMGWPLRGPRMLDLDPGLDSGPMFGVFAAGVAVVGVSALASVISLLVRYRSAAGVERRQIKWGGLGAAMALAAIVGAFFEPFWGPVGLILVLTAFQALPVTIGIAVLRYRLYDIDRIISRTLSYTLLTGVLGGVYLVAVLALSRLLAPLGAGSELSVAAATLVAAAAFAPARRRIQAAVDHRFNRARYDAQQVVARFRAQLRDEVDLTDVVAVTRSTAVRTVEPAHVSLWLRGGEATR